MTKQKLKQIRKSLGYTQREIADRLNTPISTYRKWENGSRRVPGIVEAALSNISANPKQKDWDALAGIPDKEVEK